MLRRRSQESPAETTAVLHKPKKPKRAVDPEKYRRWLGEMEAKPGVFIAVHTTTPGNTRKHWREEGREAKKQREAAYMAILAIRDTLPPFPVHVKFTRYGPRAIDKQNLQGSLKHVVDGVADFYGVDDGDPRWEFEFAPPARSKFWGVRIEVSPITPS